ncbi:hypothetical protein ACFBZI_11195 [Moraxella sp. ZJ142]|uniref:hypothetical protein n=1 Tax=Moraxella marmotae TaxID=3344520 RepID=UPI0035D46A73
MSEVDELEMLDPVSKVDELEMLDRAVYEDQFEQKKREGGMLAENFFQRAVPYRDYLEQTPLFVHQTKGEVHFKSNLVSDIIEQLRGITPEYHRPVMDARASKETQYLEFKDIYIHPEAPTIDHATNNPHRYHPPMESGWYGPVKRQFTKQVNPKTIDTNTLRAYNFAETEAGRPKMFDTISQDLYIGSPLHEVIDEENFNSRVLRIREKIAQKWANRVGFVPDFAKTSPFYTPGACDWGLLSLSEEERAIALYLVNKLLVPMLNGDMRVLADFLPLMTYAASTSGFPSWDSQEDLDRFLQELIDNFETSSDRARQAMRDDLPTTYGCEISYYGHRNVKRFGAFDPRQGRPKAEKRYYSIAAKNYQQAGEEKYKPEDFNYDVFSQENNHKYGSKTEERFYADRDKRCIGTPYTRLADWRRLHFSALHDLDYLQRTLEKAADRYVPAISPLYFMRLQAGDLLPYHQDPAVQKNLQSVKIKADIDHHSRKAKLSARQWFEDSQQHLYFNFSAEDLELAKSLSWPIVRTVKPLSKKAIPVRADVLFYQKVLSAADPKAALVPDWDNFDYDGLSKNGLMCRDDMMMIWMAFDLYEAISLLNGRDVYLYKQFKQEDFWSWPPHIRKILSYALNIPYLLEDVWESGDFSTLCVEDANDSDIAREIAYNDRVYSLWSAQEYRKNLQNPDPNLPGLPHALAKDHMFYNSLAVRLYEQALQELETLGKDILFPWIEKYVPDDKTRRLFAKDHPAVAKLDSTRILTLHQGPAITHIPDLPYFGLADNFVKGIGKEAMVAPDYELDYAKGLHTPEGFTEHFVDELKCLSFEDAPRYLDKEPHLYGWTVRTTYYNLLLTISAKDDYPLFMHAHVFNRVAEELVKKFEFKSRYRGSVESQEHYAIFEDLMGFDKDLPVEFFTDKLKNESFWSELQEYFNENGRLPNCDGHLLIELVNAEPEDLEWLTEGMEKFLAENPDYLEPSYSHRKLQGKGNFELYRYSNVALPERLNDMEIIEEEYREHKRAALAEIPF